MQNKSKILGLIWLLGILLLAAGLSMNLAFLVQQIPWSLEQKIALVLDGKAENECISSNRDSKAALDKLLKRIYPIKIDDYKFPLQVLMLRERSVNAFAVLGGKIYVHDSLLEAATTPEEIAGILSHEIEHIRLRHVLQGVLVRMGTTEGIKFLLTGDPGSFSTELTSLFLHMSFSKREEAEADQEGLLRLKLAKVSVKGIYNFFKRMESGSQYSDLISDHPSNNSRLLNLQSALDLPSKEVLSETEWKNLKNICH